MEYVEEVRDMELSRIVVSRRHRHSPIDVERFSWLMLLLVLREADRARGRAPDLDMCLDVDIDEIYAGTVKKIVAWVYDIHHRRKRTTLYVDLARRLETYRFVGAGDVSLFWSPDASDDETTMGERRERDMGGTDVDPWIPRGDVNVRIQVRPHPMYSIEQLGVDSTDLYLTFGVTVFDYYYGRTISFRHLDGDVLHVNYKCKADREPSGGQSEDGRVVCLIPGKGLLTLDGDGDGHGDWVWSGNGNGNGNVDGRDRGTLYVFFNLVLPTVPERHLNNPLIMATLNLLFGRR